MKKLISAILSAAFLSTFAGCSLANDVEDMGDSLMDSASSMVSDIMSDTHTENAKITELEAKEIALKDAGFKESEVNFVKSEYDIDDGIKKFEIEFTVKGVEYEYDINAENGEIISKSRDTAD